MAQDEGVRALTTNGEAHSARPHSELTVLAFLPRTASALQPYQLRTWLFVSHAALFLVVIVSDSIQPRLSTV